MLVFTKSGAHIRSRLRSFRIFGFIYYFCEMSEEDTRRGPKNKRTEVDTGRYISAFFLIFIGVIFLLNTTNVLDWEVWLLILRFWPVFVVLFGIQIIFGKSRFGAVICGSIAFGVFLSIMIVVLAVEGFEYRSRKLFSPEWTDKLNTALFVHGNGEMRSRKNEVKTADYLDAEELRLSLNLGMGKFTFSDQVEGNFIRTEENYFEKVGEVEIDRKLDKGVLNVDISQKTKKSILGVNTVVPEYNFILGNPEIPTSLSLDIGATKGKIELDEVILREFDVDSGTGSLDVRFSQSSLPSSQAKVNVGTGKVAIYIPEGTAYRVEFSVGVGSVQIIDQEYRKIGSEKEVISSNFQSAENKLDLRIKVGVGNFTLNYY